MPDRDAVPPGRRLRADALHNRGLILDAARDLLVEHGPDVPLDQIAARAGVSIATFYRRFEDRAALLRTIVLEESQVTIDALDGLHDRIEAGADRHAWTTGLHDLVVAATSRLAPVLAAMNCGLLPVDDEDLLHARTRVDERFRRLVDTARTAGLLRADTDHHELVVMLMHATLPVPHLTPGDNHALTSRTVHVLLAGLHPDAAGLPLPGEPFRMSDEALA